MRVPAREQSSNHMFFRCFRRRTGGAAACSGNFAKRGLVPGKLLSAIAGNHEEELHIDIQLAGVDGDLMDKLVKSISRVVSVRSVLTSEKRLLMSA